MNEELSTHFSKWQSCTACPLHKERDEIVLFKGSVPCEILFIGEGPGESEDTLGEPFCGPAGGRLDDIIEEAELRSRDFSCGFTNVVCCLPVKRDDAGYRQGIRPPKYDEVKACRPRLEEIIEICQPQAIVAVGSVAASALNKFGIQFEEELVHPARILRIENDDPDQGEMEYKKVTLKLVQLVESL